MEKKKLLVVDDDEALLFAFNKIFQHSDYLIDSSESVEKAKTLVTANEYVLVITDLRFAENEPENGYDLIKFVKTNSPVTKTILLTAFTMEDIKNEEETYEPDFNLKKPIKSETIKEIMKEIGVMK